MIRTAKTHEAKTNFSKLLREVEEGNSVLIYRGAVPIAELVPFQRSRPTCGELEPSFVGIDTDLIDEPDEELNKLFYSGKL